MLGAQVSSNRATTLNRYLVATRFLLVEQTRNRLAFLLLVGFVPIWYFFMGEITPSDPVDFKFSPTSSFLHANGHDLVLLSGGLNAITLIMGFMLFTSTRRDKQFDRRLILCGYPQPILILAKLTCLVVLSALVSFYACAVLYFFWQPERIAIVWLGFFCAALIYGGLGLLLGVLLKGELEGFFLIMMLSLTDTFLQNPIGNPAANQEYIKFFPTYSSMQLTVAGGFTQLTPWQFVFISLIWLAGFTLLGLVILLLALPLPVVGQRSEHKAG